ncbi:hypothetical protein EK21DRAFT_86522 [Setomelanomma holmii]|uniref:Uncharacterized protein n=1 Tax=Setomelanomma holmii TaxID=210430 RepID=A0A9P4HGB5_9PLEO|nr:hypothetical protein EK21DRAFT_86522 [Setomelanomma holmii]
MYIPNSRWTWAFMLTAIVQAIIALALESYVFGKFQASVQWDSVTPESHSETRTIPTYLAVFMFGYLYQLWLVWDALRLKNTIQVIGLVIYNVGILIYAAIQYDQISDAAYALGSAIDFDFWTDVKPLLIALPCLMAAATVVLAFEAWKLYDEFAWTIYKHISADLRLKRRYLTYQIYIALLKFDFFFFLAFTVQFLVVVEKTKDVEVALTSVALGVTFFLLFAAAWWVRRESVPGMIVIIIVYFIAMGYFLFKLIRMYVSSLDRQNDYKPAKKSLTAFAVLTILLLIFTIIVACMCTHNFNKGLKPHVNNKAVQSEGKQYNTEMPSISGPAPSQRMEID